MPAAQGRLAALPTLRQAHHSLRLKLYADRPKSIRDVARSASGSNTSSRKNGMIVAMALCLVPCQSGHDLLSKLPQNVVGAGN
jgi:hypothetical protein